MKLFFLPTKQAEPFHKYFSSRQAHSQFYIFLWEKYCCPNNLNAWTFPHLGRCMQAVKFPCGKIPFQRSSSYSDQEEDFNTVYVTPELSWQMLELMSIPVFKRSQTSSRSQSSFFTAVIQGHIIICSSTVLLHDILDPLTWNRDLFCFNASEVLALPALLED